MASSSRPARARYLSSIVPTSLIPEKSGNHSECSSYFCWGPYCPRCHCVRVVKSGHHHGKQRWLCRRCGYQFTSLSPPAGADDRTRKTAVTLYGHGLSLRCVGKLLATTAHSVIRWVTEYVETFCPKPTPDGAVVIEVDEMWHYLGAKTNKLWIWTALDRAV